MKTGKRILCLCLTLALVCALAVPVLAASTYFKDGMVTEGHRDYYYELSASCTRSTAQASTGYMGTDLTQTYMYVETDNDGSATYWSPKAERFTAVAHSGGLVLLANCKFYIGVVSRGSVELKPD